MKVICINDGPLPSDGVATGDDTLFVKEGKLYEVIDSFIDKGYCWFVLDGDPENIGKCFGQMSGYDSQRFASLTETDTAIDECIEILNMPEYEPINDNL